ncbi:hypothetical protein Avbf_03996 [Armadillidium vulgare]|nr:hypothetical protein Avbf_03996 [Armadillidium vulgare]
MDLGSSLKRKYCNPLVRAKKKQYMSFSAHADAKGIMQLIRHCEPKNVMLVHGENTKMDFLKQKIMEEFNINCYKPKNGETATIPVTSNFTVDVSLPLLKRSLKAVQTPVIPLSKNIDGPSSYASSSDKRNVTESESENKKQKLLHGVLVMKNNFITCSNDCRALLDSFLLKVLCESIVAILCFKIVFQHDSNLDFINYFALTENKFEVLLTGDTLNLRIMGVNEAYNELGVSSHLLTFTERFEMPSRGPVAGLTSSLNSLISHMGMEADDKYSIEICWSIKLPGWPIQTVNESEMSIGESVLINVQDEEYSRILLLSWSYQDESLGTKVLEIIRSAYKL